MNSASVEAAVKRLRTIPDQADLVRDAYLDEDNVAAAVRFAAGEEFSEVLSLLTSNIGKSSPWDVLDIGAGNGIASYAFAKANHRVLALEPDSSSDIGAGAIRRLAGSTNLKIKVLDGFAENVPLDDNSVDLVYVRQALHHTTDLSQALREFYRVLRYGGCLLATREHVVDDDMQLREFLSSHPLHKWSGGENAFPLDRYVGAITAAGLELKLVLKPFDSAINYFPRTTAEIDEQRIRNMQRRLGKYFGNIVASNLWCKNWYTERLSQRATNPGRLYSFLARKTS